MALIETLKSVISDPAETEERRGRARELLAWTAREIVRAQAHLSDKSEASDLVEWKTESLWPNFVIDPDTDKITPLVAKSTKAKPAPAPRPLNLEDEFE
jgi:hypothetical protein